MQPQPQQVASNQMRAMSNKRPQSINRKGLQGQTHQGHMPSNGSITNAAQAKHASTTNQIGQVQGNSPGLRQVKHPSHTQMLNAIGINHGPILQGQKQVAANQVQQRGNLSVGRQGALPQQPSALSQQPQAQKTPANLKGKSGSQQQKFASERQPSGSYQTNFSNLQAIQAMASAAQQPSALIQQHRDPSGMRGGKSGSRMQNNNTGSKVGMQNTSNAQVNDPKLKKISQNLYKNTE